MQPQVLGVEASGRGRGEAVCFALVAWREGGQLLQLLLADDDVAEDSGGDQEHIQAEPKMCNEKDFSVPLTPGATTDV